jgi:hypothetical protein
LLALSQVLILLFHAVFFAFVKSVLNLWILHFCVQRER